MEPIHGEPAIVRRSGARLVDTAQAIRSAVAELEAIASPDDMRSLALDRIRREAGALAGEIQRAEARYSETGRALLDFAAVHERAQADAAAAIDDAEAAEAAADRAADARRAAVLDLQALPTAAEADERRAAERRVGRAGAAADEHGADAAAAQRRHAQAVEEFEQAARRAMERIENVVEGSDLNDSLWDRFTGALDGLFDFVRDAVKAVFEAITAVVKAIVELITAVLIVIAALVLLGVIALLALAVLALAVVALLAAIALIAFAAVVLLAIGMALVAVVLVLVALVTAAVIGLLLTVVMFTAVNLMTGMDPVEALTQALIVALFALAPALWLVVKLASGAEAGDPVFVDRTEGWKPQQDQGLADLFEDLQDIDEAGHLDPNDPDTNHESVVRIVPCVAADGTIVYRIHIPSTQQWTPGGESGNDVTSDIVAKMDQAQQTQLEKMVIAAMQEHGIPPGSHVMLAGWSLGGITAGNLASDPDFTSTYKVDAIAVAGSSVDDLPIPPSIRVLDVSHTTDPVPRTENPWAPDYSNQPNRYKIDVPPPGGADALGHDSEKYKTTMQNQVDEGGSSQGTAFMADDPDADDGIQVSDYFREPTGSTDYAYTRGD
ncbi:hypothetical protein [Agromyces sp. NPDC058126]|uniref:hypothetical protein n=1 Tax=Agromyces sp. NPDC058126 TaxID=3346350 RepID=UPI0036D83938